MNIYERVIMTGTTGFFFFFEGAAAVAAAATVIAEKLKCTQCFFSPASFSHASFVMRTICCRYLRIACSLSLFLFSFYLSLSLSCILFLSHIYSLFLFLSFSFLHTYIYLLSLSLFLSPTVSFSLLAFFSHLCSSSSPEEHRRSQHPADRRVSNSRRGGGEKWKATNAILGNNVCRFC